MPNTSTSPQVPKTIRVAASFTRPSDATAYTAKDQVANSTTVPAAMQFSIPAPAGRGFRIVGATFHSSQDSTTSCALDLLLFDAAPTPSNDNAEYDMPDADVASLMGVISVAAADFGEFQDNKAAHKVLASPGIGMVAGSTGKVYGLFVARAGYTPAIAEVITVTLDVVLE